MTALGRRRVRRATVVCLALLAVVAGASAGSLAQATENGTVNETVQHERPEAAGEDGDLEQLQRWLDGQLSQQLGSSTVALSEGEYERAREMLGDDYDDRLSQYVDVAGETGEGNDTAETYQEVRESQRDLATQAEQFEAANERYEQARENGNTGEAREAAREMNRLGEQIGESGTNTNSGYEALENQTGVDTDEQRTVVTNLTEDVSERQQEVRAATFVETDLTVLGATRSISYTEPLELVGVLTDENGTALANHSATVEVAGRPQTVTTDQNGSFSLTYRPRMLRANASSVQVAYVPRNESVYLGSSASVPVDVEQVEPTLELRDATAETAFGESAGATVAVTVDGEPVDGIPVVAAVDGHRLGRETTNGSGVARVDGTMPANVSAGDQQLRASVGLENRALVPANGSAAVTVETTETALNLSSERRGDEVTLTGRLATADGRPVADQQIQLSRNGSGVMTVETGQNGTFAATIPLSRDSAGEDGRVAFGARFDGDGTNLGDARASTSVAFATGQSTGLLGLLGDRLAWLAVAGLALVGTVLGGLAWRRRGSAAQEDPDLSATSADASTASTTTTTAADRAPIERANAFLADGATGAAVRAAYAAVRERYASAETPTTHAELFEAARSLDVDERRAVERVITAYEREAFAPGAVGEGEARDVVAAAETVVERAEME